MDSECYSTFEQLGPVGLSANPNKPGAPNDQMFPNMPEVSQMIFLYVLEACLVNLE